LIDDEDEEDDLSNDDDDDILKGNYDDIKNIDSDEEDD
jgi:hypothetical protein